MADIRRIDPQDWPAVWRIVEPVFRCGDTFAFPPDATEAAARRFWVDLPLATFVAVDGGGNPLGTYYLKANQLGPGDHVCNCGYIVAETARRGGIASALCDHSQREARARGFRAMQFNSVVSTNGGAVRLWQRHGFRIVGTLPSAFRHPTLGEVDAFVMYKPLNS